MEGFCRVYFLAPRLDPLLEADIEREREEGFLYVVGGGGAGGYIGWKGGGGGEGK